MLRPWCPTQLYERGAGCGDDCRQLVRRKRGERNHRLLLESPISGPLAIPVQEARNRDPAIYDVARRTGNRRLYPEDRFRRTPETREEARMFDQVSQWLQERLMYYQYPSRSLQISGSRLPYDRFEALLEDMTDEYRANNMRKVQVYAADTLRFFEALSEALGRKNALNNQLFDEILDKALRFMPFLSLFDSEHAYHLIRAMSLLTIGDIEVVRRLLEAMTPEAQDDMSYLAAEMSREGNKLAEQIYCILNGFAVPNANEWMGWGKPRWMQRPVAFPPSRYRGY